MLQRFMTKKKSEGSETENLIEEVETDYHQIPIDKLIEKLDSSVEHGLSQEKADMLYNENGPNSLTPPKNPLLMIKFFKQLFSGFSLLLNIGAILCFIAYTISSNLEANHENEDLYLGLILVFVVMITSVFGLFHETKASKLMESFNRMVPQESVVIRDGRKISLKTEKIVVGDIIVLCGGNFVPADLRIIYSHGLKVDNSSLTGESEPQLRYASNSENTFIESENIAFAYTYVLEGTCRGVVIFTGDDTMIGRIAELSSNLNLESTTLSREINKFIKIITILAFIIGMSFFVLSVTVAKSSFISAVVFLIGIIVANVPECLLVTVTISLALTAKRMASKNCLVKNLESMETLGSTSVICSDKTGTITQNKMCVSQLFYNEKLKKIKKRVNMEDPKISKAEKYLITVACICNRAEIIKNQDKDTPISELLTTGDATECALVKFSEINYAPVSEIRSAYKKIFEIPFDSRKKTNTYVHKLMSEEKYLISIKGAPELVLDRCTKCIFKEEIVNKNDDTWKKYIGGYEFMASMGERVLAFASFTCDKEIYEGDVLHYSKEDMDFERVNFTFLGLISMRDPPRASVPDAIERCIGAGIRICMVTGDNPLTAVAIAKSVGIIANNIKNYTDIVNDMGAATNIDIHAYSAVITGSDLLRMTSQELDFIIKHFYSIVFARTTPNQKLVIVEGFQRAKYIVAVTGDGVNDTPALRKANVGIAMGITGSDVAKMAADIILMDDNFSSIVTGIKEGRLIFDNLKKTIAYTLTSNIPEISPFVLNVLCSIPLPLGTLLILIIDALTDMVPAIALAYEKEENNLMLRKPRDIKNDRLVGGRMIRYTYLIIGVLQTTSAVLTYLFVMLDHGFSWSQLKVGFNWSSSKIPFVIDSYGQEWSYSSRKELEYTAQSAYFLSIVMSQWADLFISKTRIMSIFTHGIFNNKILIFGLFFETILSIFFVYVPWCNTFLQTRPVSPRYLIPSIVFSLTLWIFDEIRRVYIRKSPKCFIYKETFY